MLAAVARESALRSGGVAGSCAIAVASSLSLSSQAQLGILPSVVQASVMHAGGVERVGRLRARPIADSAIIAVDQQRTALQGGDVVFEDGLEVAALQIANGLADELRRRQRCRRVRWRRWRQGQDLRGGCALGLHRHLRRGRHCRALNKKSGNQQPRHASLRHKPRHRYRSASRVRSVRRTTADKTFFTRSLFPGDRRTKV